MSLTIDDLSRIFHSAMADHESRNRRDRPVAGVVSDAAITAGLGAVWAAILHDLFHESPGADLEEIARLIFEARGADRGTTNGEPMTWEDAVAWFHPPMPDNHPVSASRLAAASVLAYLSPWLVPSFPPEVEAMTVSGIGSGTVVVILMDRDVEGETPNAITHSGIGVDETLGLAIDGALLARATNLEGE